jgi:hypothetical protein
MEDMRHDGVQFIVADMGSTEPGLREYLEDLDWVETYFHDKPRDWINDEYHAKNAIIDRIKHDATVFLQDDSQMIVPKETLYDCVNDLMAMKDSACVDIFGVRRATLNQTTDGKPTEVNGRSYWRRPDQHFLTTGIFKTSIFKEIGPYPVAWPTEKKYWGRSEIWYALQVVQKQLQTYRTHVPLFLSIWNDPRGGYAFIRGDKRYGYYLDPVHESGLYYKKLTSIMIENFVLGSIPLAFMNVAMAFGWDIAIDESGEHLKPSQWDIMEEGPMEDL